MVAYINHTAKSSSGRSGRQAFLRHWWSLYAGDSRWTPPYYPLARWALRPDRNPHLARFQPVYVTVEALPRRQSHRSNDPQQLAFSGSLYEVTTAAAVVLTDPRRHDGLAYLALAHWLNDPTSVKKMFDSLAEELAESGIRRLIGPTGLAPSWGGGLLVDHWDRWPPQETPYNPPYLPELLARGRPAGLARLFDLLIPEPADTISGPAELQRLAPEQVEGTVLPLLIGVTDRRPDLLPPDELEAAFLIRWLNLAAAQIWLAFMDSQPVGFIALQPDRAGRLRRAQGGRGWLWRAGLAVAGRLPLSQGRIIAGGVLPAWRGRGIGRQLLDQAVRAAGQEKWQRVAVGPVAADSPASKFLAGYGAVAGQRYELRKWSL